MLTESADIKEIMQRCYGSTKGCAKVLFPERFELPFSSLHEEIFKVLDDDSINRVVIAAPRGFGKTSLCTIAQPAKRILFKEKKFIVPISATATNAVTQGENLKRELMFNPMIQQLFGSIKAIRFRVTSGSPRVVRWLCHEALGSRFVVTCLIAIDLI